MSKIYLELDQVNGRFFEYSKEPKEGYEKNESTTGKVSYRKIYKEGAIGKLKFINESEEDFGTGKFKVASIVVENKEGDLLTLKMPVLNSKGSLNEYFEQLSTYLPNLKVGSAYRIFPYSMEVEYETKDGAKKKTTNRGFSISNYDLVDGVKLDKVERAHNFGATGDIPAVVWNEEEDMGVKKNVKNDKDRRNFLYNAFKGTLSNQATPTTPAPAQAPVEPAKGAATPPEEDLDDLPF